MGKTVSTPARRAGIGGDLYGGLEEQKGSAGLQVWEGCIETWKQASCKSMMMNQSFCESKGIIVSNVSIRNLQGRMKVFSSLRSIIVRSPLSFLGTVKYLE